MQHQKITNYTNDSQTCETGKKVLVGPSVNYLLRTCSNSSCHKSGGRSQTYGNRNWRILAEMTVEQKNLRLHEVPKVQVWALIVMQLRDARGQRCQDRQEFFFLVTSCPLIWLTGQKFEARKPRSRCCFFFVAVKVRQMTWQPVLVENSCKLVNQCAGYAPAFWHSNAKKEHLQEVKHLLSRVLACIFRQCVKMWHCLPKCNGLENYQNLWFPAKHPRL